MKKAKFKGDCWLWPYSSNKHGYGTLQSNNVRYEAHKWLYELVKGKTPAKTELDHLCRNRLCVNPEHLEPVSHAENCRRGKQTKLTEKDVIEIKRLSATLNQREISERFEISRASVGYILQGKRWI